MRWYKRIGVEPTLFLYMSAFMITSVVEQAFYVDKACRVNMNYPDYVCDDIKNPLYLNYSREVQVEVSKFKMYENVASNAIPIVLAFFLGGWSDKVGRKIPLLLGLTGNFVFSTMIVVNALQERWPLEVILLTAFLPCGLTGGNLTVFMAAFSYLSDTTTQQERTLRITLLEVAYLLPMPIGTLLGSYLFKVVQGSFAVMFAINAGLLLCSILYTLAFLEWRTTETSWANQGRAGTNCLFQLVDLRLALDSLRSMLAPRPEHRRRYLLLVLLAMAAYTFQREEASMLYLYTMNKFHWGVSDYSKFRTFQSSMFVIGLLLGVPILGKFFGLSDAMTLMTGAVSHFSARIFFSTADVPWLIYLGAGFGLLGPSVAPVLRSITSKLVPASERGKVFAIFSVADCSVPLVSGVVYSQVYINTIKKFPQAIFIVTAATQLIVFFIALYLYIAAKGSNIKQAEEQTKENDALQP